MYVNECLVGLFYDLIFGVFFMGAIVGFLYTSIYFRVVCNCFFFNLGAWNYIESVSTKVAIIKITTLCIAVLPDCIEPACSSFVYSERWLRRFTAECRYDPKIKYYIFFLLLLQLDLNKRQWDNTSICVMSNSELHYLRVYLYIIIYICILEHIQSKKVCRVKLPRQDFKYLSFRINKITN